MKIIIADDHPVFRVGMVYALKNHYGPEAEILEGSDYSEVLKLVGDNPDTDFIFCDLEMPDRKSEEGLRDVIKAAANIPVLAISGRDDIQAMRMALITGARGYLIKQATMGILKPVLDLVASGEIYVPAKVVTDAVRSNFAPATSPESPPDWIVRALSKRQVEILQALANGLSNKEIARQLNVVESTVKVQLKTIYRRINARNRTEAALAMRLQNAVFGGPQNDQSQINKPPLENS